MPPGEVPRRREEGPSPAPWEEEPRKGVVSAWWGLAVREFSSKSVCRESVRGMIYGERFLSQSCFVVIGRCRTYWMGGIRGLLVGRYGQGHPVNNSSVSKVKLEN